MLETVRVVIDTARAFLPDSQLVLTIHAESEEEYLLVYARFKQYDKARLEQIRNARAAYRPHLQRASGWILLTTDFGRWNAHEAS